MISEVTRTGGAGMNVQFIAAQPPFFSDTRAASIVRTAREYPDADGWLVEIASQSALVASKLYVGAEFQR